MEFSVVAMGYDREQVDSRMAELSEQLTCLLEQARVAAAAAEMLAQARAELAAAQREAERVRARAYQDALRARRDFEAALHARRQREQRADEILHGVRLAQVPASAEETPAVAG